MAVLRDNFLSGENSITKPPMHVGDNYLFNAKRSFLVGLENHIRCQVFQILVNCEKDKYFTH